MAAETCDEMRVRLAKYVAARDTALVGGTVASVRYGDKETRMAPGNSQRLDSIIGQLQDKITRRCDGCGGRMRYITPSG